MKNKNECLVIMAALSPVPRQRCQRKFMEICSPTPKQREMTDPARGDVTSVGKKDISSVTVQETNRK